MMKTARFTNSFARLLALMILMVLGGSPVTAKEAGGWEPNMPTDGDIILPDEAVTALLKIPWVSKYHRAANPVRLQSRFVAKEAKLEIGGSPVAIDRDLRKPGDRFARFEITGVELVSLLEGYAVSFRYPSEGVTGKAILVPHQDGWRAISVSGGES